jgi:hypothetical protein
VRSVCRRFSLPQRGRQVIEADLNCSELARLVYALGPVALGDRCDSTNDEPPRTTTAAVLPR